MQTLLNMQASRSLRGRINLFLFSHWPKPKSYRKVAQIASQGSCLCEYHTLACKTHIIYSYLSYHQPNHFLLRLFFCSLDFRINFWYWMFYSLATPFLSNITWISYLRSETWIRTPRNFFAAFTTHGSSIGRNAPVLASQSLNSSYKITCDEMSGYSFCKSRNSRAHVSHCLSEITFWLRW